MFSNFHNSAERFFVPRFLYRVGFVCVVVLKIFRKKFDFCFVISQLYTTFAMSNKQTTKQLKTKKLMKNLKVTFILKGVYLYKVIKDEPKAVIKFDNMMYKTFGEHVQIISVISIS